MTIGAIAAAGLAAVLLAVQLKSVKSEYGVYLVMAAGVFIFLYALGKMQVILDTLAMIRDSIQVNPVYLDTLLKMIGIAYVAEFSSGICKDAGYGSVGSQIEMFGKLSILAVSMPVFGALIETMQTFLA
ncbi:MAG TPA: stage III sporulation protein AD [Candidatus Lachnoclostridium stercorigallinarum]|uniref:Stage III sporulation protein AD n=1 Tax=Candidatus Lachnoclostridium stercorigallinarum TaxID=2838634 RepID=A0A9D2GI29_9FIRM|nr:stage III sporulation protein AD [Candidatus Lachnoclostridium stercorigallinarum]